MRDFIAGVVALALLLLAASLATTLQFYRRRRQRTRDAEGALGRRIVAEIPAGDDLVLSPRTRRGSITATARSTRTRSPPCAS